MNIKTTEELNAILEDYSRLKQQEEDQNKMRDITQVMKDLGVERAESFSERVRRKLRERIIAQGVQNG